MELKDCLKQLHYHWFWGLRQVNNTHQASLWLQVEAWKKEPQLVVSIREKQKKISEKIWVIRLFYWLFNLSDYAEDDHKLNAYDAVQMEEKGMFSLRKSKEVVSEISKNAVSFFKQGIVPEVVKLSRQSFSWVSNARHSWSEPSRERSVENTVPVTGNREQTLLINDTMLPHLEVLGLTCTVGETISHTSIKKAYLQKALATHPDKNPSTDTTVEFKGVLQAYEALKAMFERREPIINTDLWRTMDELSKDFQELTKELREFTKEVRQEGNDWREIRTQCEKSIAELAKRQLRIDEQNRRIDEIQRMVDERQITPPMKQETKITSDEPSSIEPAEPPVSTAPFVHNYGSIDREVEFSLVEETHPGASLRH